MVLHAEEPAKPASPALTKEVLLAKLKPGHPRLLADSERLEQLKAELATDEKLKKAFAECRADADKIVGESVSKYEIPDGKRLLATSRQVLARILALSFVYRMTGEAKYLDRAWKELEAAAAFKDWNPSHFLDTAEMTHAFGIGYDWLYDGLSDEQRKTLRTAIIEKGLNPGLACYRGKAGYGWWRNSQHNWNQVCNGGLTIGALAILDEEPDLAAEVIISGRKSIPRAMKEFAPDGAWVEGPMYWGYTMRYTVPYLACLESALGDDLGVADTPGFSETACFYLYMLGPTKLLFNFADCGAKMGSPPELFWLARKFEQPWWAWHHRTYGKPDLKYFVWYRGEGADPHDTRTPRARYFRHAEVVTMRTAWTDPEAAFAGIQAGSNAVNHNNLDIGSFVYDALGERWILDLGGDNYNLPEYFGRKRYTYYRLRAEGHNTLVLNPGKGPDQVERAGGKIVKWAEAEDRQCAVAELTPVYKDHGGKSVMRGLALYPDGRLLIQDEIETEKASTVWWFAHTKATVKLDEDGRGAELEQDGQRVRVRLAEPAGAKLSVMDARPLPGSPDPDKQNKNEGVRKLAIELNDVKETRVAVWLTPVSKKPAQDAPALKPLKDW